MKMPRPGVVFFVGLLLLARLEIFSLYIVYRNLRYHCPALHLTRSQKENNDKSPAGSVFPDSEAEDTPPADELLPPAISDIGAGTGETCAIFKAFLVRTCQQFRS